MKQPLNSQVDEPKRRQASAVIRKMLTVVLIAVSLMLYVFIMTRDLEWKRKHDAAMNQGRRALAIGDVPAARDFFSQASVADPFSAEAYFSLAEICDRRLGDEEGAFRYYLASLACAPDHPRASEAETALHAINMIRAGVIEDPQDAAADMALAANEGTLGIFAERLTPDLAPLAETYWRAWRERGVGVPIQHRIIRNNEGRFYAVLGFAFPDGVSMSMHFSCLAGHPWQLTLSFP